MGGVNLPDFGGVGREFPSVLFKTICEVKSSENLLSCLYRKRSTQVVNKIKQPFTQQSFTRAYQRRVQKVVLLRVNTWFFWEIKIAAGPLVMGLGGGGGVFGPPPPPP